MTNTKEKKFSIFQYSYLENLLTEDDAQLLSNYIYKEARTENLVDSDSEHIYKVLWLDSCIYDDIQEDILNEKETKRIDYLKSIQKLLLDVKVKMQSNNIEFLFIS